MLFAITVKHSFFKKIVISTNKNADSYFFACEITSIGIISGRY